MWWIITLYVYPLRIPSSFTLVAQKQFSLLKKYYKSIFPIDEQQFPTYAPILRHDVIVHPASPLMFRVINELKGESNDLKEAYWNWWRNQYGQLIGFDVCDSDRMSKLSVSLINTLDKVAVPSTYCQKIFIESGVRTKIYWIPHGADLKWFNEPNIWQNANIDEINPTIVQLLLYKRKTNKKIILFWLWHSPQRKGWEQVKEVYRRIRRQRNDIVLVLKTKDPYPKEYEEVMDLGAINIYGWISDYDKMALYDLADVHLNFSIGGAFEINSFEAVIRGVPSLAVNYGSWLDYLPPQFLIKKGKRVQPLPDNKLHVGYGYAVDIYDAVDKLNIVLDNINEYKLIALDTREKLKETFTWDSVGERIVKMVEDKS